MSRLENVPEMIALRGLLGNKLTALYSGVLAVLAIDERSVEVRRGVDSRCDDIEVRKERQCESNV